jgi:hypothetical protein
MRDNVYNFNMSKDNLVYITEEEARSEVYTDFDLKAGIFRVDNKKAAAQALAATRKEKQTRHEAIKNQPSLGATGISNPGDF